MDMKDMFLKEELTHELIHTQTDTAFIGELRKCVGYIKDVVSRNDIRSSTVLTEQFEDARKNLLAISEILTKRFGFNIHIAADNSGNGGTNVILPGKFSILNGDLGWYEGMKKYFLDRAGNNYKDIKSITDFEKDKESFYNQIYKNILAMEREIDRFNIVIDNKKATITGLPSDFTVVIKIDFNYLLSKKGRDMAVDGFISVVLHEIGHNFTGIEKSILGIKHSVTLLEAVRDTVGSGIKDETAILKIISNKMGKGSPMAGAKGTPNGLLLADIYLKYKGSYDGDKHNILSNLESEKQADLFVSRFGLGGASAVALTSNGVWIRYFNKDMENSIEGYTWFLAIVTIYLAVMTPILPVGMALGTIIGWIVGAGLGYKLLINRYIDMARGFFKGDVRYELDPSRVLRLKQDAIRQLRLLDKKTDKALVERLLANIKQIEERLVYIRTIEEETRKSSYLKRLIMDNQFDPESKSIIDMNNLIQDLMENDLHTKVRQL